MGSCPLAGIVCAHVAALATVGRGKGAGRGDSAPSARQVCSGRDTVLWEETHVAELSALYHGLRRAQKRTPDPCEPGALVAVAEFGYGVSKMRTPVNFSTSSSFSMNSTNSVASRSSLLRR